MGVDEEVETRIVASIYKALLKPQILPYLRLQIVDEVSENIKNLTTEEVSNYILWMKNEQAKEKR